MKIWIDEQLIEEPKSVDCIVKVIDIVRSKESMLRLRVFKLDINLMPRDCLRILHFIKDLENFRKNEKNLYGSMLVRGKDQEISKLEKKLQDKEKVLAKVKRRNKNTISDLIEYYSELVMDLKDKVRGLQYKTSPTVIVWKGKENDSGNNNHTMQDPGGDGEYLLISEVPSDD